jgi:hypothetical protein
MLVDYENFKACVTITCVLLKDLVTLSNLLCNWTNWRGLTNNIFKVRYRSKPFPNWRPNSFQSPFCDNPFENNPFCYILIGMP